MRAKKGTNKATKAIAVSRKPTLQRMSVYVLAAIPKEEVWLASRKSPRTRRAYRTDVAHFMQTFNITSADELRQVDHRAVMAWERVMREEEELEASTVRRRLAALSSLSLRTYSGIHLTSYRKFSLSAVNKQSRLKAKWYEVI